MKSTLPTKVLLAPWLLLGSVSCGTMSLSGGPRAQQLELAAGSFPDNMRPYVEDSPMAVAELEAVQGQTARASVFLYAGLGALAPCIAMPAIDRENGVTTSLTYAGIGACAVGAVLEVVAFVLSPGPDDFGEVLRAYNRERPETPWFSEDLGVPPPRRFDAAALSSVR